MVLIHLFRMPKSPDSCRVLSNETGKCAGNPIIRRHPAAKANLNRAASGPSQLDRVHDPFLE